MRMMVEEIRTGFCGRNPKDGDDLTERGLESWIKRILKDSGREVVYWIKMA